MLFEGIVTPCAVRSRRKIEEVQRLRRRGRPVAPRSARHREARSPQPIFASGSTGITGPAEEFQCAFEEERRGRRIVFRNQR
jgi:hypothetical protein